MIERLALPSWNAPPLSLDAWTSRLKELGHPARISREGSAETWIELPALHLRGFAVIENGLVEAINFEIHASDPAPALALIDEAARGLAWEVHEDDEEDDEDE